MQLNKSNKIQTLKKFSFTGIIFTIVNACLAIRDFFKSALQIKFIFIVIIIGCTILHTWFQTTNYQFINLIQKKRNKGAKVRLLFNIKLQTMHVRFGEINLIYKQKFFHFYNLKYVIADKT